MFSIFFGNSAPEYIYPTEMSDLSIKDVYKLAHRTFIRSNQNWKQSMCVYQQ